MNWAKAKLCVILKQDSWEKICEALAVCFLSVNCRGKSAQENRYQSLRASFMVIRIGSTSSFWLLNTVVYQPTSLGVVLGWGRGSGGPPPGKFFHLRWLNPKIWFSGSQVWNKTKGTVTLKHCAVHKHHAFILGGDNVNETTFIFIQHSADRVGHREQLAEKQCVHSTILQGGSIEEEFTSTAGSSRKEPPPLRRWNLPHFRFQQFCIQLIQQSGPADVDGSTPVQINHGKGARTGCQTRSSL